MKIVFFGSSSFSLAALKACEESKAHQVSVITTPPQKKGRGLHLGPTPVAAFARERGLCVEEPASLKNPEILDKVKQFEPDLFVASSYGKIIPESWLSLPKQYSLNVHPSLLPKYRGASPLPWPILNGDLVTGLTIIDIAKELDSGDIFYQEEIPLSDDWDAAKLGERLAELSFDALTKLFRKIEEGKPLSRRPQDASQATYARKLEKKDGIVIWGESAQGIARKIRALQPWPGTSIEIHGERVKLLKGHISSSVVSPDSAAGTILEIGNEELILATGQGALSLGRVQPEGKRPMDGAEYARGRHFGKGMILTSKKI